MNLKDSEFLTEGRFIDYTIVFIIGKKLLTPFKKWRAYELGLIDEKGKIIKKPETSEEKDSLTLLDKFIMKVKRLIKTKNKLVLLTGLMLLREQQEGLDWSDVKSISDDDILKQAEKKLKAEEVILRFKKDINENFNCEDEFWTEFLKIKL